MEESRGRILTGLIRVAPRRGDHRVALRAAVSLAAPLLVLWALGRLDLSVYASFGAFASLYGRFDGYGDRVRLRVPCSCSRCCWARPCRGVRRPTRCGSSS